MASLHLRVPQLGSARILKSASSARLRKITVSRLYNILGFILAFGSLFFQPISKGGSIKEEIWALFFLGFFLIPFFHKKLRLYQGESQSFLICLLWFDFFLSFSTYITSTIFKSLCTKYWCLSYLFYIYCRLSGMLLQGFANIFFNSFKKVIK